MTGTDLDPFDSEQLWGNVPVRTSVGEMRGGCMARQTCHKSHFKTPIHPIPNVISQHWPQLDVKKCLVFVFFIFQNFALSLLQLI